jgi:integrase
MALYKRSPGGPWWTRFTVRGKPVRRSTGTTERERAEEFETALRARFWRQSHLGEQVHTWREATIRWRADSVWRKSTREANERALKHFQRLNPVVVAAIDAGVCKAARQHLERLGLAATSVNRYMAVMRGVLRACVEWGWLTHAPPVPMAYVPDREPVWLTAQQCEALIAQLPQHLRAPALFCALTGLRMSNARDLEWSRVDLERAHLWIPSSHYKTRRAHGVALPAEAVQLLAAIPRVSGHVFTYRRERIRGTFNTKAFRAARKRAGLTCRWHDLRHTFASWLAAAGASDRVLQDMGGWASARMPGRYAHLRSADLRPWADAVGTNAVTALTEALRPDAPKRLKKLVPEIGIEPTTPSLRNIGARKKA